MKSLSLVLLLFVLTATTKSYSQNLKNETIKVSGNCGMCKQKIEKAAKSAGAKTAVWDAEKQSLTVSFNEAKTNLLKIETAIAGVGYDTQDVLATSEAYEKLHGCCKYERTMTIEKKIE